MSFDFNEIEENCYNLFYNDLDVNVFEEWVYKNNALKLLLSSDDYLELISLNYRTKYSKYEIRKIIMKYMDIGKFETKYLLDLLYKALYSKKDLPDILTTFYELYCKGYGFLENIGINYGLNCIVPPSPKYKVNNWAELKQYEKDEIINSFFPEIINALNEVIQWINDSKIIVTGLKSEEDKYLFIDKRQ